MAALDPSAEPEADDEGKVPSVHRSTLKIIKANSEGDEDEEADDYLQDLLAGGDDEEDSDEEENAGPSDPSKTKKARQEAAIKKLIAATKADSDDEMADAGAKKSKKGKGKATEEDEEESDEDDDLELEDYVVCTLDTERVCALRSLLFDDPLRLTHCHRTTSSLSTLLLARTRRSSSPLPAPTLFT